jgi:hypothetical protein
MQYHSARVGQKPQLLTVCRARLPANFLSGGSAPKPAASMFKMVVGAGVVGATLSSFYTFWKSKREEENMKRCTLGQFLQHEFAPRGNIYNFMDP